MDSQQAASCVQLDDEGDLVLLVRGVGKSGSGSSSFLVSSKILSLASRVFAAMLSPRFAEGRQLQEARQQGPDQWPIITLEEDDVVAMDFILSVIHFKADRLQTQIPLTAEEIANIAIHSDKYDFNGSLTPWITEWCGHHRFPVSARRRLRDMGYGILAAYLFRSPQLETMSAHFAKTMPPDFTETWEKYKLMECLPEEMWNHLSQQITRAHSRLRLATLKTLDRLHAKVKLGTTRCTRIGAQNGDDCESLACHMLYLDVLKEVGIWPSLLPFETLPVHKVARLINEAKGLAVCGRDHPNLGTTSSLGPCPLLEELGSLSLHVERVQAEMKGVQSSKVSRTQT